MHFTAPAISALRLQRFHRWAMLWLRWFGGFLDCVTCAGPLSKQAYAVAHVWLDRIERLIVAIILIRAAGRVRRLPARKGVSPHRRREQALTRAVLGGKLRRALRSRDLRARIAALSQNVGAFVACVARRLPWGLTRRRPILTTREAKSAAAFENVLAHPSAADTS